ncbi:D-xylulose reductase (plasmid) [Hartmannibacter diazotrophicus]|uniref:D-xylulose reductase n=1 Tax=Hartmannibacter diazotrophicus TaxID=1482074 RepID=A0A2C9DE69_9HYPH|nr:NAD(P)-dependent alcohol dehydrogenase [Hartmannibacter diazotrophicus]SON58468.1 D-xylulose reductase [Hartmannibacter diazotrophicus]
MANSQMALVLERKGKLSLREIELSNKIGSNDVKIAIKVVGICGSDVHYYTHGKIGPFEVNAPMVLGHEAAGVVVECGAGVDHLKIGDRVCMEPGIPTTLSKASRLGIYNLDPDVVFWATPPVHGVLTPYAIHPAALSFKLPDNVTDAEGAMIEPFAVGMQAAAKANIQPGDIAVVTGAGPIGTMVALAALAGGCATVVLADFAKPKLDIASQYQGIIPCDLNKNSLPEMISQLTGGWGADIVFECSGAAAAWKDIDRILRPAGTIIAVGLPISSVPVDISTLSTKEIQIKTVFRYAHQYERAIALIASGKVDLKPLITATFSFNEAITAFERASLGLPDDVKLQIAL